MRSVFGGDDLKVVPRKIRRQLPANRWFAGLAFLEICVRWSRELLWRLTAAQRPRRGGLLDEQQAIVNSRNAPLVKAGTVLKKNGPEVPGIVGHGEPLCHRPAFRQGPQI